MQVFLSVGTGLSDPQEAFVCAFEARLRSVGLEPCSIGRNRFSPDAPLRAVINLMAECSGVIVLAIERYRFETGVERYGSAKEQPLGITLLPTPWNQIEAAIAYGRGLPLMVLVDETLRCDGLLEKGNDWFVHSLAIVPSALNSEAFVGLLEGWRTKLAKLRPDEVAPAPLAPFDLGKMSIGEIAGKAKPAEMWALLAALVTALAGAFALGVKLAS